MDTSAAVTTAGQVADLLDAVAEADGRIAAEADRIAASRAAVSHATMERLTRVAEQLRPDVTARVQLCALEPNLLLAGTSVWLKRRRREQHSASARAQARWGGLSA